jgi:hypothetical protein
MAYATININPQTESVVSCVTHKNGENGTNFECPLKYGVV